MLNARMVVIFVVLDERCNLARANCERLTLALNEKPLAPQLEREKTDE